MNTIVKVQIPLYRSGSAEPVCLVYPEGRRPCIEQMLTRPVREAMGDRMVAYFEAAFSFGRWVIGKRVEDQKW